MNKLIVEALGTFFLMLTIGMTVIAPGADILAPLAIGSILAVMVYAGGPISGGHYNPAVSLAAAIRGALPMKSLIPYWIVQVVGAGLASAVVIYLKKDAIGAEEALVPEVGPALLAEFLFAFALCFVVLSTATAKRSEGNSYFGWAIGFTVMVGAFAVGSISGAAFNPAVAVGLCVTKLLACGSLWIYLAANLLGGVAAGLVFLGVNGRE